MQLDMIQRLSLNTKEYINEGSLLLGFDTREVRVHSTQITEIYPDVKVESAYNEELASAHATAMEEEYQAAKKKTTILVTLLVLGIGSLIGVGIYLFMKRRKRVQALETI